MAKSGVEYTLALPVREACSVYFPRILKFQKNFLIKMDDEYAELFFKERRSILSDIDQFLDQVSSFLTKALKLARLKNIRIDVPQLTSMDLMLKSLCFIHGFYLFPANGDCDRSSTIQGR